MLDYILKSPSLKIQAASINPLIHCFLLSTDILGPQLYEPVLLFSLPILIMFYVLFVGSAITGPIGKECADLWPRIASAANAIV